jgi:two-component system response regulator YesN
MRREALGHRAPVGQRDDPGRKRRRRLMAQARRYLNEHFNDPICLDDVARALEVSAYYLSHVFSEENGFSLFTYLNALRMERARELLQERTCNVSEVARAVGYEDTNYFSKVFRKHFGRPPSDYL